MGANRFVIYLCVFISFILSKVSALKTKGTSPNAVIYERRNQQGKFVSYKTAPYMWDDMGELIRSEGLKEIAEVCVTGTFILYSQAGYQAANNGQIRIISAKNRCIRPGYAMSYQTINKYNIDTPVIAVFEQSLNRGRAVVITGRKIMGWFESQTVRSFVVQGKESWSVLTNTGKSYCLVPSEKFSTPLCFAQNLKLNRLSMPEVWVKVERGCSTDEKIVTIQLKDCIKAFSGALEELKFTTNKNKGKHMTGDDDDDDEHDGNNGNSKLATKESPFNFDDCTKNEDILGLLSYVQFNDFLDDVQIDNPRNKDHLEFLEALETTMTIAEESCPIVSTRFVRMVRELYIAKMEQLVWSKKNYTYKLTELDGQLKDCHKNLETSGLMEMFRKKAEYRLSKKDYGSEWLPEHFHKELKYLLGLPCGNATTYGRCTPFNTMQETLHVVFNMVSIACHIGLNFQTNFFHDFALEFKSFYLDPLTDHWIKTRSESMRLDPLVFGGLVPLVELQSLGVCATDIYGRMINFESFPRDIKMSDPLRKK